MPRSLHGATPSLETIQATIRAVDALNADVLSPIAVATPRRLTEFGYMFDSLQSDDTNLLPSGQDTVNNLILLGKSIRDPNPDEAEDSMIPTAYTFLGQFIDHDITLETMSDDFGDLEDPEVLGAMDKVLQRIRNQRTATLDLDSVYDPPSPFDGERMRLGEVTPTGKSVPGKDRYNDLPRAPKDPRPVYDRFALIGDARNDENLVIAQLQVAMLRAHNAIVTSGHSWSDARRLLQQLYQWVVVNDFLVRIVGQDIVDNVKQGNRFFVPTAAHFYMPLEFSVAAYRFGHSMVRDTYDYNIYHPDASLEDLFSYTALSGQLDPDSTTDHPTLPDHVVIQWENFVGVTPNPARAIDTRLVEPLFHLRDEAGVEHLGTTARLAVRNLLRGYKLRMPTGQAVASEMGRTPIDDTDLLNLILANADRVQMDNENREALRNSGFDSHTPLWFYILAEAEIEEGGKRLGPVGGTIVAEVLIGLVRHSPNSILDLGEDWDPSQISGELEMKIDPNFDLSDLLKLAGVL